MKKGPKFDLMIFIIVLALLGIGITMVFSASSVKALAEYQDSFYFLKKQLLSGTIGIIIMLYLSKFDYHKLQGQKAFALYAIAVALLIFVLLPSVGRVINGSRRWLDLIFLQFQPSEIAKIALIVFLANMLSYKTKFNRKFVEGLLYPLVAIGVMGGLVFVEPDLGTALVLAGTGVIMMFAAGTDWRYLLALGIAGIPIVGGAIMSAEYRRKRFFSFWDPWDDPLNTDFHISQSLMALGSGGILGLGLGRSRQKYFYLPEQHTDFIFAVLGEELGFGGCCLVIILFGLLAFLGFTVAAKARDDFGSLLAVGITSLIILQVIINIGVVTSSMPVTGLTLPFISYGGTSLIFLLAGVGLLLSVAREIREGSSR